MQLYTTGPREFWSNKAFFFFWGGGAMPMHHAHTAISISTLRYQLPYCTRVLHQKLKSPIIGPSTYFSRPAAPKRHSNGNGKTRQPGCDV